MLKKAYTILLALCLSVSAFGQTGSLSVAERNALQGFNDTIDRLADDFVTVGKKTIRIKGYFSASVKGL